MDRDDSHGSEVGETARYQAGAALSRLPTALSREEIVGIIWAASGPIRVPGRCWPLEVALDVLATGLPAAGLLKSAMTAWPVAVTSTGRMHVGIDRMLQYLSGSGLLVVEGSGWDVGYRPALNWLAQCSAARKVLRAVERAAVDAAAQRLVACATTWSKNARASLPPKSFTS
jgi:hypothetical protein